MAAPPVSVTSAVITFLACFAIAYSGEMEANFAPWTVMGPVRLLVTTALACKHNVQLSGATRAFPVARSSFAALQVQTDGTGSILVNFTGAALNYSVILYNVTGMRSIEIHIGDPKEHGDVVAVLCASLFPDATDTLNGLACAGSLDSDGMLGPLLLPLGNHLDVSVLHDK